MNILILSSISPYKSAGFVNDHIQALIQAGHNVDFLTKYKFDNMQSNMYSVYDIEEPVKRNKTLSVIIKSFLKQHFRKVVVYLKNRKPSNLITLHDELNPGTPPELVVNRLNNKYDLIITTFWVGMISSRTLELLSEKYKCPIIIIAVDLGPITGGCYYIGECKGYAKGCKSCPAYKQFPSKEQSALNFAYKKSVYDKISCAYAGNQWAREWVKMSRIIDKRKVFPMGIVIDDKIFKRYNKVQAREALGLPLDKFIMFAGVANINIPRKGFGKLVESVNIVTNKIGKDNIQLVVASRDSKSIEGLFESKILNIGFLSTEKLALMYAAADVFLSPSLDDGGPSMVNQSFMCGTPVIAFKVGVALEMVENYQTGYLAELGDTKDFANGIIGMYESIKNREEYIRHNCRRIAMERNSYQTFASRVEEIYNSLISE